MNPPDGRGVRRPGRWPSRDGRDPGAARALALASFWDCRLTVAETVLLAVLALALAAVHLRPVLNSAASVYLIGGCAALSWLSPVTGFFYAACAQFLPFPQGVGLNPAQIGFFSWAVVAVVRYRRLRFTRLADLGVVAPFLFWSLLTSPTFDSGLWIEYGKALGYSIIACQLASASGGRYMKCLLGLSLGSLMVIVAYWCHIAGLPVDMNEGGGERGGFSRLGSVRADAVMVWPAVLFAVAGLLGLATASLWSPRPAARSRWLLPFGFTAPLLAIPCLFATMSSGAYAGLLGLGGAYAVLMPVCFGGGLRNRRAVNRLAVYAVGMLVTGAILYQVDILGLRRRAEAMWDYQKRMTAERGLAASRQDVWSTALTTIASHPLTGIGISGEMEAVPDEYQEEGYYLAHNVFLDCGRGGGVPGMLLFGAFFFYPALLMLRSRDRERFFPFLFLHVAFLIFFMGLSFQFYKTFWAGWMLMVVAARAVPASRAGAPAANLRRSRAPEGP